VVVIILGMFVLPNLIGVLTSLNVPLPLVTRIVIAVSNAFTDYGTIGIPAMLGGLFVLMILNKYTSLKVVFQWFTFRIPGVGALARQATIARFGVILGGLMKAGVPVTEAMQSLVEVTSIVAYRNLYSRMLDHITIGDSFSKSFQGIKGSEKLIPPSVQQLVITGEKSGALADIMLKIADIYDKKASETAQKLPIILEPMLLLFMGGLVGTIAFAILVPIYSIVGNVGR
jgi:type IV pilus assembly protein PilC